MKTTLWLMMCGLALAVPAPALWSAEPEASRTTGRVLVLDNEHTLEGDILQVGDDYRVRRAVGEVWVPGAKALRLCAGWEDAYAFLSTRANQNDPDERIRLARWCQLHGLPKQALAEVNAILAVRPNHAEARRLQSLLRRAVALAPPAPVVAAQLAPPASLARVDLGTESMSRFATHIQPILMNACAVCHASNRGGEFRLVRSFNGSATQRATQHNLAAVVAQIDKQRPGLSPLLIKAVGMHGSPPRVPLKGRQTAAYRHLQEWVEMTLATNPHLVAEAAPAAPSRASLELKPELKTETTRLPGPADNVATFQPAVPANGGELAAPTVVSMSGPASGKSPAPAKPVDSQMPPTVPGTPRPRVTPQPEPPPPAEPVDAFDPVIFNRQMQPGKSP